MKRIISLILLTSFIISCQDSNSKRQSFFKVVSSSFAKEFCSCLFVVGQSKDYCQKYASQIIPVSKFSVNESERIVSALAFGITSLAVYQGEKLGCRLE